MSGKINQNCYLSYDVLEWLHYSIKTRDVDPHSSYADPDQPNLVNAEPATGQKIIKSKYF